MAGLGVDLPVLAAPMSGGPTTPALVVAAAHAGSVGFLAGGYKTAEQLRDQITAVRASGPGEVAFGVNLFVPNPSPVDRSAYRLYAAALQPLAERYGVELPVEPVEDDDGWEAKIDLLLHNPVPLVSFTFAIPPRPVIDRLRAAGTILAQTVTDSAEARAATDAGVDLLIAQGCAAGGHSATLTPGRFPEQIPTAVLIAMLADATRLPVIAAGGLATPAQLAAVLDSGAAAAMVGTALLRSPESGANAVHQAALEHRHDTTVLTRAFTGRAARALPNAFTDHHGADAPAGYPAIHHLTSPIRKAATAAGDPDAVHLWAGIGYQHATTDPAAAILSVLASAV